MLKPESKSNEYIISKYFYTKSYEFKRFDNITDETIKNIEKQIETYKRKYEDKVNKNNKKILYYNLLRYLTNNKKYTFDEKIIFIILYSDPNLECLSVHLQYDIISNERIDKEANEYVRNDLIMEKINIEEQIKEKLQSSVGFYDRNLVNYELAYFKKFRHEELRFGIKKNFTRKFFKTYTTYLKKLIISEEDLNETIEMAQEYTKLYGIPNINDLCFQLLNQQESFNFSSIKQMLIFFIYVLDKNLELYNIYEEYCNWRTIEKEAIKTVGFYNQNLILLERIYKKSYNQETEY